jgi:hypothetical protein
VSPSQNAINWDTVAEELAAMMHDARQPLELRRRIFFFMLQCVGAVGEA